LSEKVVLTADGSLMSDYRHNEFLGFGTCAPPNVIPDMVYRWLIFPPIKTKDGLPIAAPYGLRKVEAQLLNEGFNVSTVAPDHLAKRVRDAKALGIHVMDPFGLGPASSTLAALFKKEPFLAQYFRALLSSPPVRRAKRHGMKVIVGGPGAWQFRYRPNFVKKYGIDCVIEGEGEKVVGKVFRAALNGENLPALYEVSAGESPSLEEIPEIVGPSINGLVEIGRGCCRGCKFCGVTLRPLRWCPEDKILREISVNSQAGIGGVTLHTEDVMLYGSRNTSPNEEKLIKLHETVIKKCDGITWSHCSLAAVAANPKLFSSLAEIITQKRPWWGAEIGLETGSAELAEKIMPAKALPYTPKEWPDVIRAGMGLMHDNNLIPAGTLIVGVPEETEEDLIKTIELMDDLKNCRSLIVPLFFVPMGKLKDEDWFKDTGMTKLHEELLTKCLQHDYRWIRGLIDASFAGNWREKTTGPFYKVFAFLVEIAAKRQGIDINPQID
jgi:radical SAM superfamily enzyme YgiQ (UPF0313 family)